MTTSEFRAVLDCVKRRSTALARPENFMTTTATRSCSKGRCSMMDWSAVRSFSMRRSVVMCTQSVVPTAPRVWTGQGSEAYCSPHDSARAAFCHESQIHTLYGNEHGTPPCPQSSRRQPRTPYPRNQAQRTRRLPPADRASGHSRRHHDAANLQTWRRLHHEPKYMSTHRGKPFKILLGTHAKQYTK